MPIRPRLAHIAKFLVSNIPCDLVLLGFHFLLQNGAVVGDRDLPDNRKLNPSLEPQVVFVQSDAIVLLHSEVMILSQVQRGRGDCAEGM